MSHRSAAVCSAALCGVLAIGCAVTPDGAGGRNFARGTVVVARGYPLLVDREGQGLELVALAPGATKLGYMELREVAAGDPITYTWVETHAGVRQARRVEVAPLVRHELAFRVTHEVLQRELAAEPRPVLIDARSRGEFAAGHLPGARLMPMELDDGALARELGAIPPTPIVLYGANSRDERPGRLALRLVESGATGVRVLEGGLAPWVLEERPLELLPEDAAGIALPGGAWVVLDSRPASDYADGTIPGAISMPLEGFRGEEFGGKRPLPPLLVFSGEGSDARAAELADRIRRYRFGSSVRSLVRISMLSGGMDGWRRAGLPVVPGATGLKRIPFRPQLGGEISREEFDELWAAGGGDRTTFIDARSGPWAEVPGVLRIPLEQLTEKLPALERDQEYVVFCTVGERSRVAAEILRRNGFSARFLRAQFED